MAGAFALHDTVQTLVTIAYGIWRKRWYALTTAWLISVVGWFTVSTIPYKYESVARVKIDSDAILQNITSIIQTNNSNQNTSRNVQAIRDQMTTREHLERIIRRTNYLERLASSDIETNRLIQDLKKEVIIRPSGDDVYSIAYATDDTRLTDAQRAEVARDVVVGLVDVFISNRTADGDGDRGIDFLRARINDLEARLELADNEKIRFRQANLEVLNGGSIANKLDRAQKDLTETQNEKAELKAQLDTLAENLKNVSPTISVAARNSGGGVRSPKQERLTKLYEDLDKVYLSGLKDKHPDVVALKSRIETLEAEIQAEDEERQREIELVAQTGKSTGNVTAQPNPMYEELMSTVIVQQSELRKLETRESTELAQYNNLRVLAESAPEVEAEWDRLEDATEAMERELRDLRRDEIQIETADAAIELDSKSFEVLDEAVIPRQPSGPPRLIYLTGALVGGLLVGVAVALVLSQIKPVVMSVDQLRGSFDLPILGNISRVMSERDLKAKTYDLMFFGGMFMLLFIAYSGLIALDMFGN